MKKRYPYISNTEAVVFSLTLSFLFLVLLMSIFVRV
jgi:hypothetical protein